MIVHICNDIGVWGKGFVLSISKRWSEPEAAYRRMPHRILGDVQFVNVSKTITVANIIGQNGIWRKYHQQPIDYTAVRTGLEKVGTFAKEIGASIQMPRIGCGLAGGDKRRILDMIDDFSKMIENEVTVAG